MFCTIEAFNDFDGRFPANKTRILMHKNGGIMLLWF